jgi:hypothetical protein
VLQEADRPALSRRHVNKANPHQGDEEIRPGKVDGDGPPQTYGVRRPCGEGGAGPGEGGQTQGPLQALAKAPGNEQDLIGLKSQLRD